jgi:hypothetical protein
VGAADTLRDIRGYAAAGRIKYTRHARERMAQRRVNEADIVSALVHARVCVPADKGNWKATGPDVDGDDLEVVVAVVDGVVVVTVF